MDEEIGYIGGSNCYTAGVYRLRLYGRADD